jgi:hypothetical protein
MKFRFYMETNMGRRRASLRTARLSDFGIIFLISISYIFLQQLLKPARAISTRKSGIPISDILSFSPNFTNTCQIGRKKLVSH